MEGILVFLPSIFPGILGLAIVLAGCSSNPGAGPGGPDRHRDGTSRSAAKNLIKEASAEEFGGGLCEETVSVAMAAGQDYEALVARAIGKDRQALHILFDLTAHAGFDAASSEGNSAVLGAMLRCLGDGFFANCLAQETVEVRKKVRESLDYDMGPAGEPPPSDEWGQFRTNCPLTYATCFSVQERVTSLVLCCRREVHGFQPDYKMGEMGLEAVPELLKFMSDQRKVWVRIGTPEGGPESRDVGVAYLYADDEGPRSTVAQFALLCICRIREPRSGTAEEFEAVWKPVMSELTNHDGKVSAKTIADIKAWYKGTKSQSTTRAETPEKPE